MIRIAHGVISAVLLATLAGCGGGSGAAGSGSASYATLLQQSRGWAGRYILPNRRMDVTPVAEMPNSGRLRYRGVGAVSLEDGARNTPEFLGRFDAVADISSGRLTGKVTEFQSGDPAMRVRGSVSVDAVIVDNGFTGRHAGTLKVNGNTERMSGSYAGAFAGRRAKAIGGVGFGRTDRLGAYSLLTLGER